LFQAKTHVFDIAFNNFGVKMTVESGVDVYEDKCSVRKNGVSVKQSEAEAKEQKVVLKAITAAVGEGKIEVGAKGALIVT